MDELQKFYAHRGHFVRILFTVDDQLCKTGCVQELEHRTITLTDSYHVVGDSRGDAQNECCSCQLTFSVDLRKRIWVQVYLDDGVRIDPVDLTVGSLSYHFTAFH